MKRNIIIALFYISFVGIIYSQNLEWINTEGQAIQAEFISLEGEKLKILKDLREFEVNINNLNEKSKNQALDLSKGLLYYLLINNKFIFTSDFDGDKVPFRFGRDGRIICKPEHGFVDSWRIKDNKLYLKYGTFKDMEVGALFELRVSIYGENQLSFQSIPNWGEIKTYVNKND